MESLFYTLLEQTAKTFKTELQKELFANISSLIKAELNNIYDHNSADNLLTTADVAKLLSVSKSSVNILRKDPQFPVLKIGDSVRFQRESVLEYIKNINGKGGVVS